ncbi:MAG TPA: alpha/beta hydrolase [Flavobacterium sp.]|jgi:pimeloyl-ACP methyl ester carboxylesterase
MTKKSNKPSRSLKIPKLILITTKFLSFISPRLVTLLAARLFTSPIKYKIPRRESEMYHKSIQKRVTILKINKDVVVYEYGKSNKKVLLVHGWSGRGTQLVKIADELLLNNFSTISFDAPAHGKSPGKTTIMLEFIETIAYLEEQYGPFEAAIGHSLGGISLLNATKNGLGIQRLVTIGSADIIEDIIADFVHKLQLKPEAVQWLEKHFEKKYNKTMNSLSAYLSAKAITIPVLVIHDNDDDEVPVKCAVHIHKNLRNGELMITKGLGHRKILGDKEVIEKIIDFIKN